MKIFAIRKSLLYALLFFVIPLSGLLIYPHYQDGTPHSIMQVFQKDGSLKLDEGCRPVSNFDKYLQELNEANKSNNVICRFSGDLTTMSKLIQCEVMHGRVQGQIYWAENFNECLKIKNNLEKKH